jgi:hypothetical protein
MIHGSAPTPADAVAADAPRIASHCRTTVLCVRRDYRTHARALWVVQPEAEYARWALRGREPPMRSDRQIPPCVSFFSFFLSLAHRSALLDGHVARRNVMTHCAKLDWNPKRLLFLRGRPF